MHENNLKKIEENNKPFVREMLNFSIIFAHNHTIGTKSGKKLRK
jgi:predicted glutamine amidotransferase